MTAKQRWQCLATAAGSTLLLTLARADSAAPPAEFWIYMAEFADEQNVVFDPADFALMTNLPGNHSDKSKSSLQDDSKTTTQDSGNKDGDGAEKLP